MANNNLTGCIPPCFRNMSSLEYLDLSNNHMSCELFEHNLPRGDSSLWYLKLSNNNFYGQLTPSVFNRTRLRYLYLDGNKFGGEFVGEVPGTFPPALQIVDISSNLLSGMLPRGIGNSSIYQMEGIDLSKNYFEDEKSGFIYIMQPIRYYRIDGIEKLHGCRRRWPKSMVVHHLFDSLPIRSVPSKYMVLLLSHVGGAYATEVQKLAATILELICEGLGLESGYFGGKLSEIPSKREPVLWLLYRCGIGLRLVFCVVLSGTSFTVRHELLLAVLCLICSD
ncbi:hypothetical protein OIU77_018419 [Salix suchowensis]|uniref:Uncharacterized protein n=1 Tax=Salix suchowensis TaxID=1278906 RepID=A0ABQ9CDG8_9ROSI|nr:hypothetical protein OIU77_018419 [Salix suchowensis]